MSAGSWKLENWVIVTKLWLPSVSPCDIKLPTPANHFFGVGGGIQNPHAGCICALFSPFGERQQSAKRGIGLVIGSWEGTRTNGQQGCSGETAQSDTKEGTRWPWGPQQLCHGVLGLPLTVGFICVPAEGQVVGKSKGEMTFPSSSRRCRLPSWRKIEFLEERAMEKDDKIQWSECTWITPTVLNWLWNKISKISYFECLGLRCTAY